MMTTMRVGQQLVELLLEAGLRSLLMGAALIAALWVLRVRQVQAERTVWLLALGAALAMPAMAYWVAVPSRLAQSSGFPVHVSAPARAGVASSVGVGLSRGDKPTMWAGSPASTPLALAATADLLPKVERATARVQTLSHFLRSVANRIREGKNRAESKARSILASAAGPALPYAVSFYLTVAAALLLRLAIGLALTLRLRRRARPLAPNPYLDVRISNEVATPVTIASSIVLPASYAGWDAAKQRVVLAHEGAHVRQSDFYVQLLAGLHRAVFWFSPFSWWLHGRLSALGEALSDHAALQVADSRASYAEVLLEFATSARGPLAGVAMARSGNLRPRVERLLNERLFRESFSGARRWSAVLAAGLVPLVALVSASVVRVDAAEISRRIPPVAGFVAQVQSSGQGAETPTAPAALTVPAFSLGTGSSVGAGPSVGAGSSVSAGSSSIAAPTPLPEPSPRPQTTNPAPPSAATPPPAPAAGVSFHYDSDNGETFAYVSGSGQRSMSFSGQYDKSFEEALKTTQGDFIYYRHDGKAYIVQDPGLLAQARALYAPMQELGRQQSALGQEQAGARVPAPDLSRELAEVEAATRSLKEAQATQGLDAASMAKLRADIANLKLDSATSAKLEAEMAGKGIDPATYAKLEAEMAGKGIDSAEIARIQTDVAKAHIDEAQLSRLQAQLGAIQGQLGALQGRVAEEQARLRRGEQQGAIGEKQGRLGERQSKIAEEAQRKLKPLVEQAIRDGRATPVE